MLDASTGKHYSLPSRSTTFQFPKGDNRFDRGLTFIKEVMRRNLIQFYDVLEVCKITAEVVNIDCHLQNP